MKEKLLSVFVVVAICMSCISGASKLSDASARRLTSSQQERADEIARYAMDNYDKYKVLPSLAVTQAMEESTLGDHCSGYNLWGICSGAEQYGSLEEGTKRYLEVINNGYYKKAVGNKDFYSSINAILNGGYCEGNSNYVSECVWLYETYDFGKYDRQMFKEIAEKKAKEEERKEKEREEKERKAREKYVNKFLWRVEYDPTVPEDSIKICSSYAKCGTVQMIGTTGCYFYEVTTETEDNGFVIYSSNMLLQGHWVTLKLNENATKG